MRMHTALLKLPDHIADFNQMSRLEAADQDVVVLHNTESPPGLFYNAKRRRAVQYQLSFNLISGFSAFGEGREKTFD